MNAPGAPVPSWGGGQMGGGIPRAPRAGPGPPPSPHIAIGSLQPGPAARTGRTGRRWAVPTAPPWGRQCWGGPHFAPVPWEGTRVPAAALRPRACGEKSGEVCDWREPRELRALLDLELRSHGEPPQRLLQRCRDVARYSVKTGHPRFFNQLFSGLDHHALAGRLLTEALNTSQYTYEIAPVFVLMEEVVLAKLRELVGWSSGDGTFCPGGSISNMYAMNVARFQRFPEGRQRGSRALPRLALFASQ
uniref:Cysteine sulfinic acid decarboxylase n=1 Tax=Anser cygnoides TaxID=8845 RepID=A0A8B9IKS5_ANSCY